MRTSTPGTRPVLFFSVDVYTCKAFDMESAVEYTARFFERAPDRRQGVLTMSATTVDGRRRAATAWRKR